MFLFFFELYEIESPSQCLPSPENPSLQEQSYDPLVFLHTALALQLCFPEAHSSTSENITFNQLICGPNYNKQFSIRGNNLKCWLKKNLLARSQIKIRIFHSMAIFQMTVNVCTSFNRSSGAVGKLLLLLGVLTYRAFSPR